MTMHLQRTGVKGHEFIGGIPQKRPARQNRQMPAPEPLHNNVADRLRRHAAERPDALAVVAIKGNREQTITFAELDRDADLLAKGLLQSGVVAEQRLALLVKPSVEFVTLVFALLRSGATMVLVDSGLGTKNIIRCLASTEPEGFVAIPAGHALRMVYRKQFADARQNVVVGRRFPGSGLSLKKLRQLGGAFEGSLPSVSEDATAAIVFTSGSTGPPKGVVYRHQTFVTQADEIEKQYGLQPGGVDLACFPLFGLFNVACGVTTVLPDMDFSKPAACNPQKLITAANRWECTQSFASPAVWEKLSRYGEQTGEKIPTLRSVFSCGAPVPAATIERTLAMVHAEAQMHTPYGATESLPVATLEAKEILSDTAGQTDQGAGVCVGRKFDSIDWRVIRITDQPIESIEQTQELPPGEIGELIVRGPQVSRAYYQGNGATVSDANRLAKIRDRDSVWHRMGDVGYLDGPENTNPRFWYCGRKSHRVTTPNGDLFTIPIEAILNTQPLVRRTALVGIGPPGKQTPAVAYELLPFDLIISQWPHTSANEIERLAHQGLRELATSHELTEPIQHFFEMKTLPVDIRHNSKIFREKIRIEAEKRITLPHSWLRRGAS